VIVDRLLQHGAAIYGTGRIALDTIRVLRSSGVQIRRVFDHVPQSSVQVDGIEFAQATSHEFILEADRGTALVIGIFNRYADVASLINRARSAGWVEIYTFVELYEELTAQLGPRYWLAPRAILAGADERISQCMTLFEDVQSKSLFQNVVRFRRTGDYSVLPSPMLEDQYSPRDLPRWNNPVRMVDGGAFDGDTIRAFIASGYDLTHVAAFEPDPRNLERLRANVQSIKDVEIEVFDYGLWSRPATLSFEAEGAASSAITGAGATTIRCERLDDLALPFSPSFLKLDVEGAELDALHGAIATMRAHRPALAICLYHRPDDLWEIPLWLSTALDDYRFALRLHCFSGFELVLYAYPTEQYGTVQSKL
jgi:FkbM family methyltransferase